MKAQITRSEAVFDETLHPRQSGADVTVDHVIASAGGMVLDPSHRARLKHDFARLTLLELSANLRKSARRAEALATSKSAPSEIIYRARLAWTDPAGQRGLSTIEGRLILPRDRPLSVNRPPDEINRDLSGFVRVDAISSTVPSREQVVDYIAPAVLGNLIVALLIPTQFLQSSPLEGAGVLLQAHHKFQ